MSSRQEHPAAPVRQSDIDAGREPARTMRQVTSAVRQDTAGAGARLYSLRLILDGESIYGPVTVSDEAREALTDALDGLSGHLKRIEEKLVLAWKAEDEAR